MRRLFLVLLTCLALIVGIVPIYAESYPNGAVKSDVSIVVNGKPVKPEREIVSISGRNLVPARTVFQEIGARVDWNEEKATVDIIKGESRVSMKIGSYDAKVNGIEKLMEAPPILIRGTVMVPVRFVAESFGVTVTWSGSDKTVYLGIPERDRETVSRGDDNKSVTKSNGEKYIVVIDPGHGGRDPGAVYGGVNEKDLNLDISLKLNSLLKEYGIATYMTRSSDKYVDLYARTEYANKLNADLFVSVHNNAGMSSTSGSMMLYYPAASGVSRDFASIFLSEVTSKLGTKNLGLIARPNLVVLRTTKMPAVLAEIGYMTNTAELKRLKTDAFRQQAAEALRDAILKVLKKI